jgi:ABC-type glycerol-3-phosphate transport system substrate-binding protein
MTMTYHRKRRGQVMALAGAATLTLATLAGCSPSAAPPPSGDSGELSGTVDVRAYGDWYFVKDFADLFMKEHPGVTIEVGGITNDELRQSGGRLFLSEESPDLVTATVAGELLQRWVDAGALQPVDGAWSGSGLERAVAPAIVQAATAADGKKYAAPIGLTILPQLFYNVDAYQAAGFDTANGGHDFASAAQFTSVNKALQSAGFEPPIAYDGASLEGPWTHFMPASCGEETYLAISGNWKKDGDTSATYTNPCVVKALTELKSWSDSGFIQEGFRVVTYDQSKALFDTGKSAAWLQGSWAPPGYTPPFDWNWTFFPPVDGGMSQAPVPIAVDSFLVPAKAKNSAAAQKFVEFMLSKSTLETGMGKVPARTDVELSKVITDPLTLSLAETIQDRQLIQSWVSLVPAELRDSLNLIVGDQLMAEGSLTPEQAAAALQQAAEGLRAKQ